MFTPEVLAGYKLAAVCVCLCMYIYIYISVFKYFIYLKHFKFIEVILKCLRLLLRVNFKYGGKVVDISMLLVRLLF